MIRSRVFVLGAISLFLAGCLCAEADVPSAPAKRDKAEEKVEELQELTKEVLGTAETKFNDAESTKSDLESQKNKAERAVSDAKTAAGKIKAEERKKEADAVVEKASEELGEFRKLYDAAKAKVDQAFNDMDEFVKRAKELDNNAKNKLLPASVEKEDYTNVIQNAATATSDTQRLKEEIGASNVLSDKDPVLVKLRDSAKKIQVFKYKAESIAIVSRIETALKTAQTDIQSIHQERDKINTIVQAMNTKCENASDSLKSSLTQLCTTAESQLKTATSKVTEAQKCNDDMQDNKKQVDKDLAAIKAATDEDKATEEAGKIKRHEELINAELQKIKQALRATDTAFSSAKRAQQQMQNEMSQHSSKSGTELNNAKTQDKTSEQPIDANLDSTEQNKSVQVTHKERQNPKDDNSKSLNNDKLHKSTKDITNNSLIGGKVATRSAANDSAVTVFIQLLVILVMFAVLH